jgi:hypothetical protein
MSLLLLLPSSIFFSWVVRRFPRKPQAMGVVSTGE